MATNHNLDISVWTLGVSNENRSKPLSFQSEEVTELKETMFAVNPALMLIGWSSKSSAAEWQSEWATKKKKNKKKPRRTINTKNH